MAGTKLSGEGKRRVRLTWTTELRLGLLILKEEYNLGWPDAIAVFNNVFATDISACGLQDASKSCLMAQYGERTFPRWTPAVNASEAERQSIFNRIERAAQRLGIRIKRNVVQTQRRDYRTPPPSGSSMHKKRPRLSQYVYSASADRYGHNSNSYEDQEDEDYLPQRPSKRTTTRRVTAVLIDEPSEAESSSLGRPLTKQPAPITPKTPSSQSDRQHKKRGRPARSRTPTPRPMTIVPKTPRSQSRRRPGATIEYRYPSGQMVLLTPKEHRETKKDLIPVSEAAAHPPVSLLFRYWNDECQSPLTDNGFIAGRFSHTIILPPPSPDLGSAYFPWSDFASHLNRDPTHSPLISTSNNFIWIVRLALKQQREGKNGRISLIDPTKLDRRALFHAQPFHTALCKKRPFTNGAFLYHGMHEFLVWSQISKDAIITTSPVQALVNLAAQDAEIGAFLRLDQLGEARTGFNTKILPALRQQKITLNPRTIRAMARVCNALQLPITQVEAISSLVSDLIQGLGLLLEPKDNNGWSIIATHFADAMYTSPASTLRQAPVRFQDYQNLKWAFLDACRWAGGDPNARQKPQHMSAMLRRARDIGLHSVGDILVAELDMARLSITGFENKQRRLFAGMSIQALLADTEEDEDEDIADVTENDDDRIVYDSDSEDRITYETEGEHEDEEPIRNVRRRLW